ncbi:MAG: hypothetical protein R3D63_08705 [Paracoccaceae bacterium]
MSRCQPLTFAPVTLAVVLAGLPAAAQTCPTDVGDLAQGIVVTYEDGATSTFGPGEQPGTLSEIYREAGGVTYRNVLGQGLHLLNLSEIGPDGQYVPDTGFAYVYDAPLPAAVEPLQGWSVPYHTQGAGGEWVGTYSGNAGPEVEIVIGDCRYPGLEVTLMQKDGDFSSMFQIDYLPGLGIGVLRAWGEPFGEVTRLTPVSIMLKEQL